MTLPCLSMRTFLLSSTSNAPGPWWLMRTSAWSWRTLRCESPPRACGTTKEPSTWQSKSRCPSPLGFTLLSPLTTPRGSSSPQERSGWRSWMPAPPEASLWTDVPKLTDACYRSMRTTFFHVQDTQEEQDYCRAWCPARPVATAGAGAEMGGRAGWRQDLAKA